jgi:hypothetical protein
MTRKLTISLPDEIAERLDREKNVSAFVADSIRRRMDAEHSRRVLTQLGFDLSDEGIADARARREAALAGVTREVNERARQIQQELAAARARYQR